MKRVLVAACAAFLMTGAVRAETDLTEMSAAEAAKAIAAGEITSEALVKALLEKAKAARSGNAFITLDADGAIAAAKVVDAARAEGKDLGPLAGVPIVAKDNIMAAGLPTTGGTPALKDWIAPSDAPVLAKLKAAGAILLGKTNMHELAFGITSNNAAFGAVANAYDATRSAGGSSGGTGAAVGGRMAPAGLGTDTGGSVRIPAALNGVAGLRPTVGRYPQAGIVPISHTRDTAGPIARTVVDLALLDGIIAGEPTEIAPADVASLRIGVPAVFNDNVDPETDRLVKAALKKLEDAGATLVPLDMAEIMPLNDKVGFPLALWEVKGDLAAFLKDNGAGLTVEDVAKKVASPDVQFVFNEMVLGDKAIPDAVYDAAIADARPKLQALYARTFTENHLDAIAFPTTPLPAPPIEGADMTVTLNGKDVPTFQTYIRNTDPGSNAGLPGLTVPVGLTDGGLPVGLEFDGPAFTDRHLLAIGLAVEGLLPAMPAPK